MRRHCCLLCLLLLSLTLVGQSSKNTINPLSKEIFFSIDTLVTSFTDSTEASYFLELNPNRFSSSLPNWDAHYTHYLSFSVNSGKTSTFYLFGNETEGIEVYQTDQQGKLIQKINPVDYTPAASVVFPISVPGRTACRFVIRVKAQGLSYSFWLIQSTQLENFFHYYLGLLLEDIAELWVMAGMLLMMFLYIGSKFIQLKSAEYGYYAAYIIFLFFYVGLRILTILDQNASHILGDLYYYLNNQLQVGAYAMYFPFLAAYLNTKTKNPSLHQKLVWLPAILVTYMAMDGLFIYFDLIEIHIFFWNAIRFTLLLTVLYIAYRVSKMNSPYGLYPVVGALFLDFFGLVSMILSISPSLTNPLTYPFSHPIFYYFMGITIELLFFSLGLGFKNKQDEIEKIEAQEALKLAAERQKFERYKTVVEVRENERARIAKDLHDGVGGTLSGIKISLTNLLSQLALSENQKLQFARSVDLLDNSVHELRKVSHNMMPPSLAQFGLASAIRDYCDTLNGMKTLRIAFQLIGHEVRQPLSHEIVIYRIMQELINNSIKHAQAQQLLVELVFNPSVLAITVEDDGKGFDSSILTHSKSAGWKNIRSRVDFLHGAIDLRTSQSGTSVQIQLPIQVD
ncbi:MAG: hypothetical protein OJF59_002002 [Cytophagales bacterium]|jgi:signal transduction histidine kinase|nr:MAG: hypothetical protein OJF59_002002 [Cytophagales bacterium]